MRESRNDRPKSPTPSSGSKIRQTESSSSLTEGKQQQQRQTASLRRTKTSPVNGRKNAGFSAPKKPVARNRAARLLARQGNYGKQAAEKDLGQFSAEDFKYEPSMAEIFYEEIHAPQKRAIGLKPDRDNTEDGIFISSKKDLRKELKKQLSSGTMLARRQMKFLGRNNSNKSTKR